MLKFKNILVFILFLLASFEKINGQTAEDHFRLKAMKIRKKVFGKKSAEIIESYGNLGNAYREKKKYKTAIKYFEKALENKIIQRGEGHKDLVRFYKNMSDVYYLMQNKAKGGFYKNKLERIAQN